MRYSEPIVVDGLRFAGRLDTSTWDLEAGVPGEVVTTIRVSRVALGEAWSPTIFAPPDGAVVAEDLRGD